MMMVIIIINITHANSRARLFLLIKVLINKVIVNVIKFPKDSYQINNLPLGITTGDIQFRLIQASLKLQRPFLGCMKEQDPLSLC